MRYTFVKKFAQAEKVGTNYVMVEIVTLTITTKKHQVAFGILLFAITLSIASNLVFVIGAFMNERFVYVSSLGFALILGYFLFKLSQKSKISNI